MGKHFDTPVSGFYYILRDGSLRERQDAYGLLVILDCSMILKLKGIPQ